MKHLKDIVEELWENYWYNDQRLLNNEYIVVEDIIDEHLKNIDPKWIINDLTKYFDKAYDIYFDKLTQLLYLTYTDDQKKDKEFMKLISIYQYFIKYCYYDKSSNEYIVHLEAIYPKKIDTSKYKIFFHLTTKDNVNRIMKTGLRPRYNRFENMSNWKQYKQNSKKKMSNFVKYICIILKV